MIASPQYTTGEPVLMDTDSKQLAYNGLFDGAHFAVQDSHYLHASLDPQKTYTLGFVKSRSTVEEMQKVFWGCDPSIVLAGTESETELLYDTAQKIVELLPTLASLTVVLLADPMGMDVSNFITIVLAI